MYAFLSSSLWNLIPSNGLFPKSSGDIVTTNAEFAFSVSLAWLLIPFTASNPSSDDAFTTYPPGHIQNEYTPLFCLVWYVNL